tara:strand:+ start:166 stop:378 length:213 start_codon:yes stop_codon:yes gene_type:complete
VILGGWNGVGMKLHFFINGLLSSCISYLLKRDLRNKNNKVTPKTTENSLKKISPLKILLKFIKDLFFLIS